jgi:hypothetical protein
MTEIKFYTNGLKGWLHNQKTVLHNKNCTSYKFTTPTGQFIEMNILNNIINVIDSNIDYNILETTKHQKYISIRI